MSSQATVDALSSMGARADRTLWMLANDAITYADPYPHGPPVGVINVTTGEWVPT